MIRCPHCETENNLSIFDYSRLGNRSSQKWEIMFQCNVCQSSFTHFIDGMKNEKQLLRTIKKALKPFKGQAHIQETVAFDWDTDLGGYDFSKKKKIRPQDY